MGKNRKLFLKDKSNINVHNNINFNVHNNIFQTKKSQIAVFLLVGFVMFLVVIFVISAAAQANRQRYQDEADRVANVLISSTTFRMFVESCVASSADIALRVLSMHGGFIPDLKVPGTNQSVNENVQFMIYRDDDLNFDYDYGNVSSLAFNQYKTAYLLTKGPYDVVPQYPCPLFGTACGGPGTPLFEDGVHYCNFSLSNPESISSCTYGYRRPISMEIGPQSIRRQLEHKVSHEVSNCLNMSYFRYELGYNVNDVLSKDVVSQVLFGDGYVAFDIGVPLTVEISSAESLRFTNSRHIINLDFKSMLENLFMGPNSPLHRDWSDINYRLKEGIESTITMSNIDYLVEHRVHQNFKDDLFILKHESFTLDGEPYEFRFAIGNRVPVLSVIDYAPENATCEILVPPGTNFTIDPEFADPDNLDELNVSYTFNRPAQQENWGRINNRIHKNLTLEDDGLRIFVNVSDGQYYNFQEVRVCVDENVDLTYNPKIELLFEYEDFDDKEYLASINRDVQIITMEDPIKLTSGVGFSGEVRWKIGSCAETVSSSCVVFPGWKSCDDEFNVSVENITDYFRDCNVNYGYYDDIKMISPELEEFVLPVVVKECLPHRDLSNLGDNNEYLTTNVCCNDNFRFRGLGSFADEQEQLYCGNPLEPDIFHIDSNNVFIKRFSSECLPDRGNYYEDLSGSFTTHLTREIPSSDVEGSRRCLGCGVFGEVTTNMTRTYDISMRDSFQDTFESQYFRDNDGVVHPYVCNPNFACVASILTTRRGRYDINNYVQNEGRDSGILKCQAACNQGQCNYAINCVCDSGCGMAVNDVCDGFAVGELTGTCTKGIPGQDYFPDVCNEACNPVDATERVFRCDDETENPDSDCLHCHPLCDGLTPRHILNTCEPVDNAQNSGVRNMCNDEGRVVDSVQGDGRMVCVYSPTTGCTAEPICNGKFVNEIIVDSGGHTQVTHGSVMFADYCNEDCQVADSNICWRVPGVNMVDTLCSGREPGEPFSEYGPRSIDEAFCTNTCAFESCYNFAYKGGPECLSNPTRENCCYNEDDDVPLEVKCNRLFPTEQDCSR